MESYWLLNLTGKNTDEKEGFAISISIAMLVICFVPATALAAVPVAIDLSAPPIVDGTGYTVAGNAITLTGGDYVITGSTTTCYIIAAGNANVTLNNASINATSASQCAFYINDGVTVNMTLTGASTLTSGGGYAETDVTTGRTLNITAASTGSLTVTGGNGDGERGSAGIGGEAYGDGGTITISGGDSNGNRLRHLGCILWQCGHRRRQRRRPRRYHYDFGWIRICHRYLYV